MIFKELQAKVFQSQISNFKAQILKKWSGKDDRFNK